MLKGLTDGAIQAFQHINQGFFVAPNQRCEHVVLVICDCSAGDGMDRSDADRAAAGDQLL
ncbi:MAG TPA: hypothetical protein VK025_01225 [Steroidobacter sp.]|jgi:hypothetical protein|nr:hypothetical protein [Steroidobacteraceae bacterium]HLS80009.1 hypothetical protein [Steroidobacter sp.]